MYINFSHYHKKHTNWRPKLDDKLNTRVIPNNRLNIKEEKNIINNETNGSCTHVLVFQFSLF